MRIARVTGRVAASVKAAQLTGHRLLLVDCISAEGVVQQADMVITDACDAGPGDLVLVAHGSAARIAASTQGIPTDATAVALLDHLSIGSRTVDLEALRQDRRGRGQPGRQ